MNKYISYLLVFVLTIYSAILISIEVHTSQEFVRNFFTDIKGDVPFYAVNTSLSVFLLLGTSLLFVIVLKTRSETENSRNILFYRSQVILFAYLGLDDRFLIHESIGYILGINDDSIVTGLGVLKIILILALSSYQRWSKTTRNYLLAAAACSISMLLIDDTFPSKMILRLSLEDLSKTWANAFIFMFAWSILMHNICTLKLKNKT